MPLVLHTSLLQAYRAFLAKLSPKTYFDDAYQRQRSSSKLLLRLKAKARRTRVAADPFRAFRRLLASTTSKLLLNRKAASQSKLSRVFRRTPASSSPVGPPEIQKLFGQEGWIRLCLILALSSASKLFMRFATHTEIKGSHHLQQAFDREEGQALITVSNHVGSIDDPLIIATLVPSAHVFRSQNVRWTMCATDRCFSNDTLASFFRAVKVLPVERGAGLHQLGMRAAEYRLNQGDWVHIFPEGTRSRNGDLLPLRLGIGKLVANCDRLPVVVPFVHSGMRAVMPAGSTLPKIGNSVRISVGEPITFDDIIHKADEDDWTDKELYLAITHKIGRRMAELWSKLENRPLPSWSLLQPFTPSPQKHVSRDLYWSIRVMSAQTMNHKAARIMQRTQQHIADYLDYCRLRSQLMTEQLSLIHS